MTSQTQRHSNKDKKSSSVWRVLTLGDVISISSGSGLSKSNRDDNGEYLVYGGNGVTGKHSEYLFETKKLIIGRVGANCGNAYITKPKSWVTDNAFVVTFNEDEIDLHFLKEILNYMRLNNYSSSTAQPVISQAKIYPISISLPPIREQQAIVSKIEELFSELDKGIESLKLAQQQLKVYRQSVLKWAFEGRLTNEDVKDGKLPKEWKFTKLDSVATKITDGEHITPRRTFTGVLLLSARNIQNGYLELKNVDFIPEDEYARIIKRCNPEYGDILISCSGSIGRICMVPNNLRFTLVRSVALIKLKKEHSSKYFEYLFQSPFLQKQIEKGKKATAQANLFLGPIKDLNVILCPLKEQNQVVNSIEASLSLADKMEESIVHSLQQSEVMRQSILKRAFEGSLTH